MSQNGDFSRGKQVTFQTNQAMPAQALLLVNGHYIWGGHTTGYSTQTNANVVFNQSNLNVFVESFSFSPPSAYSCVYDYDLSASVGQNYFKSVQNTAAATTTTSQILTAVHDYFFAYSSPYSGAFDLLDTMFIPRACASKSYNMTQMDYFYGQNTKYYSLSKVVVSGVNMNQIENQMNGVNSYIFQNGSSTNQFAILSTATSSASASIAVQTDDENLVGTQRTIIRSCDRTSNLLELNLYINVTSNSAPEFVTDLTT